MYAQHCRLGQNGRSRDRLRDASLSELVIVYTYVSLRRFADAQRGSISELLSRRDSTSALDFRDIVKYRIDDYGFRAWVVELSPDAASSAKAFSTPRLRHAYYFISQCRDSLLGEWQSSCRFKPGDFAFFWVRKGRRGTAQSQPLILSCQYDFRYRREFLPCDRHGFGNHHDLPVAHDRVIFIYVFLV